jgi:hypothetical protein
MAASLGCGPKLPPVGLDLIRHFYFHVAALITKLDLFLPSVVTGLWPWPAGWETGHRHVWRFQVEHHAAADDDFIGRVQWMQWRTDKFHESLLERLEVA